jgi:ferredoxin
MNRRRKVDRTLIAKEIECDGEYCGACSCLVKHSSESVTCAEFNKALFPAYGERRAERCSDCHMAERLANGEEMR